MATGDPTCPIHGQIRCNCYEDGIRYRWSHLTRDGQDVYVAVHSGEQFMYQGEEGRKAYGPQRDNGKAYSVEKIDPVESLLWLTAPKNRLQQIWGVIMFYHPDWTGMDIPTALGSLVKEMFIDNDVHGYRAFVVRKALQALQNPGHIEYAAAPWDMKGE